jgi:hypothetical protein
MVISPYGCGDAALIFCASDCWKKGVSFNWFRDQKKVG